MVNRDVFRCLVLVNRLDDLDDFYSISSDVVSSAMLR